MNKSGTLHVLVCLMFDVVGGCCIKIKKKTMNFAILQSTRLKNLENVSLSLYYWIKANITLTAIN